MNRRNRK